MPEAAAVARPGMQSGVAEWLAYSDDLVRTGQYEYLGKGKVIVIEAAAGAAVPGVAETSRVGVRLDWRNDDTVPGKIVDNYIRIAQSYDKRVLLALDPVVRKDGRVGLPDIPDPAWKPGQPGRLETKGKLKGKWIATEEETNAWDPGRPPMIEQRLRDRASGFVDGTKLMVFQPVHQVLFQPEIGGALAATYWTLECGHDPANRTQVAFLVNVDTGQAYFYGGRFILNPVG